MRKCCCFWPTTWHRVMAERAILSELKVRKTDGMRQGRVVWALLSSLTMTWSENGARREITVPAGFETDYASVPRFFWRIVPPGGRYADAAVIHDYLYKKKIGTRKEADRIFMLAMKGVGVGLRQRALMYRAVRMFGARGWGS